MITRPFAHHFAFEFRAGLRDRSLLLLNYLFPLLFFVLMAALMGKINPAFISTMIPAMTIFAVMCSYLLGTPATIVAAREAGVYRSFRVNGVPGWAGLAAPVLGNAVHMGLIAIIITILGHAVFGAPLPPDTLRFLLGWACIVAAMAGMGVLVAVVAPNARAANLISQLVYIPSILLGGLMTPPGLLPPVLDRVSLLFPATQAMRVFRGEGNWGISVAALLLGSALAILSAALLYEWDPRNTRPSGRKFLALLALLPYAATMLLLK